MISAPFAQSPPFLYQHQDLAKRSKFDSRDLIKRHFIRSALTTTLIVDGLKGCSYLHPLHSLNRWGWHLEAYEPSEVVRRGIVNQMVISRGVSVARLVQAHGSRTQCVVHRIK
jgi:hypothetical protein